MRNFIFGLIVGFTVTFGLCYGYYTNELDNLRLHYIEEAISAIEEAAL